MYGYSISSKGVGNGIGHLFALVLLLSACRDNVTNPSTQCRVQMTYDAEVTTLIRPEKSSDAALLSDLDRALTLPKREGERVQLCIDAEGNYTISTEYITPENPIEYPAYTVGVWLKPRYKRSVNVNGEITYYNEANEVVEVGYTDGDSHSGLVIGILNSLNELSKSAALTDREFASALDTLSAHGLPITHHDDKIATSRISHADGSFSVIVIDKKARMQVGQLDYDANGALSTFYLLEVEGVAPKVLFKRWHRVFFFNAVDSNVRMKHETITKFKHFSLTI